MSCKTETKTIGDHEYGVTQWSAEKAILTKFQLMKIFGSSLALMVSKPKDADNNEANDAKSLSEGLSELFKHTSPEELLLLIKSCVIGVSCDGKRITESTFVELYSGDNLLEVYKVFIFVLQVNYSNLLKGQLAENFLAKIEGKL